MQSSVQQLGSYAKDQKFWFDEGTGPESGADTDAKADIWTNRADFDAKMKDLVDRSATLATVAKTGDFARSKAAFFDTANTCKACHDKYKNE